MNPLTDSLNSHSAPAGVCRFYDREHQRTVVRIGPGDYYLSASGEAVVTTLGSCVAACLWDPQLGLGGMNHFMLPGSPDPESVLGAGNRYGIFAMETLVNEYMKMGGSRRRLQIKVTGGGRIGMGSASVSNSNIAFIRQFLKTEGLEATASDLGGNQPRKVFFDPSSGLLRVRKLQPVGSQNILATEEAYRKSLTAQPVSGTFELF